MKIYLDPKQKTWKMKEPAKIKLSCYLQYALIEFPFKEQALENTVESGQPPSI